MGEHPHYGGDSTSGPVLQTYVELPIYLEPSTLEWPYRGNSKAELCCWVWEGKSNDLHLNGSTLTNTMGLSFTCIGPPPVFRERGLQGSSPNEAAGVSLARYKPLCVEPFSWLEAAPSTSYSFTRWKGFTINDALMQMALPSCLFAIPSTKYQSWVKNGKVKASMLRFRVYICAWIQVSFNKGGTENLTTVGLEITELSIAAYRFMLMWRMAGECRLFCLRFA